MYGTSATMTTHAPWIEGIVGAVSNYSWGLSTAYSLNDSVRSQMVADFARLLTEKSLNDEGWRRALIDSRQSDRFDFRLRTPGEGEPS